MPKLVTSGCSGADQEGLPYHDRCYYHGLQGERLAAYAATGRIPKAEQAFGGLFSLTDDFGLASMYAGASGIVIEVRLSHTASIEAANPGEMLTMVSDISESEFVVALEDAIDYGWPA